MRIARARGWLLPALIILAGTAWADPEDAFVGTYDLEGRYDNRRKTAADLEVVRTDDGIVVNRTGRWTANRWRNVPPFTWTSSDVRVEDGLLEVTFLVGVDGTPVAGDDAAGLADIIAGDASPEAAGAVIKDDADLHERATNGSPKLAELPRGTEVRVLRGVDRESGIFSDRQWLEVELVGGLRGFMEAKHVEVTEGANVFVARYEVDGTDVTEVVENRTRFNPEEWWSSIHTAGDRLSGPPPGEEPSEDPAEPHTGRVKLGGELEVKADGRYDVVIPTDGTLTLKVDSGQIARILDPSGEALEGEAAAERQVVIGHEDPVLGTYVAVLDGAVAEGASLSARFVQDGQIDSRIRPWSSHTYYPLNDGNSRALHAEDGPLAKFDEVLGLEHEESALWWERGTDYRTGFGLERGHYTKTSRPSEKTAEADWFADLNGDGVIETADVTSADYFARFDTDESGLIEESEASARFKEGVIRAIWLTYDTDFDGLVEPTEINPSFVSRHDTDDSGAVDEEEWKAALRSSFGHILTSRSASSLAAFMKQDIDEDGALNIDELDPPGAIDFMDSSDVDGDYENFFDRDNIAVTTSSTTHYGNKVEESGGQVKLYKGREKDELVVELAREDVEEIERGIADGDLDDSYSVGWWGHCNAWAMASIVFRKPAGEIEREGVTCSVRDQKGVLIEYGMGATEDSTFWWTQWGGDDIPLDRYAAGFHRQMHRWLRVEQKGLMADMDFKNPKNSLNFAVWNYPLLGYEATMTEAEGDDPYVLDCRVSITKGSYSDEDSSSTSSTTYTLHFDDQGDIRTGDDARTKWTKGSDENPQFIRYLIHPYRFTGPGKSRNRNVTEERLEAFFGEHLKYNRIEDIEAEEAAAAADGLPGDPG